MYTFFFSFACNSFFSVAVFCVEECLGFTNTDLLVVNILWKANKCFKNLIYFSFLKSIEKITNQQMKNRLVCRRKTCFNHTFDLTQRAEQLSKRLKIFTLG